MPEVDGLLGNADDRYVARRLKKQRLALRHERRLKGVVGQVDYRLIHV